MKIGKAALYTLTILINCTVSKVYACEPDDPACPHDVGFLILDQNFVASPPNTIVIDAGVTDEEVRTRLQEISNSSTQFCTRQYPNAALATLLRASATPGQNVYVRRRESCRADSSLAQFNVNWSNAILTSALTTNTAAPWVERRLFAFQIIQSFIGKPITFKYLGVLLQRYNITTKVWANIGWTWISPAAQTMYSTARTRMNLGTERVPLYKG